MKARRSLFFLIITGWTTCLTLQANAIPPEAQNLISHYRMQPIPVEGGWFAQVQRTPELIPGPALPKRYNNVPHPMSTAILFLETTQNFSALHRLKTAEIYHFYAGDPIRLLLLNPDGTAQTLTLGPSNPVSVIPEGTWQGSIPQGHSGWSLLGTTMAPGFIPQDFEIGSRTTLISQYPSLKTDIMALTRHP